MRARALSEYRAHNIPTRPIVEVVASTNRVLARGIVELISLELAWHPIRASLSKCPRGHAGNAGIGGIEAQACGVSGSLERMSIGPAHRPLLPYELGQTCKDAITRAFIEGLLVRCDLAANPLIEGV